MALTKKDGKWICHCGKESRNDDSEYDWVCDQWPLCGKATINGN